MGKFDDYLFRSSQVGMFTCVPEQLTEKQLNTMNGYEERINTGGKPLTKTEDKRYVNIKDQYYKSQVYTLTETQKTELRKLVFQAKYNRKPKPINSKYLTKGLEVEKVGRDIIGETLGLGLLSYDPERKSNDYIIGSRDVYHDSLIIDIKSAYDLDSFSNIIDKSYKENKLYEYQMTSYMKLWNIDTALICHVLIDTPIDLLFNELRPYFNSVRYFNKLTNSFYDGSFDYVKNIIYNHVFTYNALLKLCSTPFELFDNYYEFSISDFEDFEEIPVENRIHIIKLNYDPNIWKQITKSIDKCREYMNSVDEYEDNKWQELIDELK